MNVNSGDVEPRVLLFRGRGLVSSLIRLQTRSQYSHAALLMRSGLIVESWQGVGIRVKRLRDWKGVDAFRVSRATESQLDSAINFCLSRVGNKYDYRSVLRFVTRRGASPNDRWFCSELVCAGLAHALCPLLVRIHPAQISPGMMAWSPRLRLDMDFEVPDICLK